MSAKKGGFQINLKRPRGNMNLLSGCLGLVATLGAVGLVLPEQLASADHLAAGWAPVVFRRDLVRLQVDSHVVLFVCHMTAEGAGQLAILRPGGIGFHHICRRTECQKSDNQVCFIDTGRQS
jgi:hypothetical protein